MEEQQRNIDEFFRQSLSDYREAPPGAVWQDIAGRLDEEQGKRRRFFLRWPWVALSLLLIVSGTWMVVGLNNRNDISSNQYQSSGEVKEIIARTESQGGTLEPVGNTHETDEALQKDLPGKQKPEEVAVKKTTISTPAVVQPAITPSIQPASSSPASEGLAVNEVETVVNPSPALVEESRRQDKLVSLAPRKSKVPAGNGHRANVSPARTLETERIPVVRAEPREVGGNQITQAPVQPRKHEALSSLSARRSGIVSGNKVVSAPSIERKELEAERVPVVKAEARMVEQISPAAAVEQGNQWQKPTADHISALKATQNKQLAKGQQVRAPEALLADNSPIPAASISSAGRGMAMEEAPVVALQARPGSEPAKTEMPANPAPTAVSLPGMESNVSTNASEKLPESNVLETPELRSKQPVSLAALVGYEHGFNSPVQNRYNASLRLLWHATQAISIGLQPAFRLGYLPTTSLTQSKSYYSSTMQVDSVHTADESPTIRNVIDSIYSYVVREKYDSIFVKGTSAGGSFWEVEVPLVLNYKLNKSWSVYLGPSVNFGGKLSYSNSGSPQTHTTVRKDSLAQSQQLPIAAFNGYFGKPSLQPYSSYKPASDVVDPAPVRFGYVFGIGYSWNNILAQASVHQQLSGYGDLSQPLKDVYSSPHVRISIGYLLFAPKRVAKGTAQ